MSRRAWRCTHRLLRNVIRKQKKAGSFDVDPESYTVGYRAYIKVWDEDKAGTFPALTMLPWSQAAVEELDEETAASDLSFAFLGYGLLAVFTLVVLWRPRDRVRSQAMMVRAPLHRARRGREGSCGTVPVVCAVLCPGSAKPSRTPASAPVTACLQTFAAMTSVFMAVGTSFGLAARTCVRR